MRFGGGGNGVADHDGAIAEERRPRRGWKMHVGNQRVDGRHQLHSRGRGSNRSIIARTDAHAGTPGSLAQRRHDLINELKLLHAPFRSSGRSSTASLSSTPLTYLKLPSAPKTRASSTYSSITTRNGTSILCLSS